MTVDDIDWVDIRDLDLHDYLCEAMIGGSEKEVEENCAITDLNDFLNVELRTLCTDLASCLVWAKKK